MKLWIFLFVYTMPTLLFAQANSSISDDNLITVQDQEVENQEAYELMMNVMNNRYNLNTVSAQELSLLTFLSPQQIQNFIRYREEADGFLSKYELQAIPDWDSVAVYRVAPFVIVDDQRPAERLMKRMTKKESAYIVIGYQLPQKRKEGFLTNKIENAFQGSLGRTYFRFRTSHAGDFSFGITAENDEGEPMRFKSLRPGFDYFSLHFQLQNKGRVKNLIIGDYQAQFGQGLALGGLFGLGKNAEAVTTMRRTTVGFLPYTSAFEGGALRGLALTYEASKNIFVNVFLSQISRDGNIESDSTDEESFSSLLNGGLHRNNMELDKRHSITERQAGAGVVYRKHTLEIGSMLHATLFSAKMQHAASPVYHYSFHGNSFGQASIFGNYSFNNFACFGEAVTQTNGAWGVVGGMLGSLHPKFDLSILLRHYTPDFFTVFSNAISENTFPNNETGIYWGWTYKWNKRFFLTGYLDLFKFPWLRFRNYSPSDGHEWLLRFTMQPTRQSHLYIQLREESKTRNLSETSNKTYQPVLHTRRNIQISTEFPAGKLISLKTSLFTSAFDFNQHHSHGLLIAQDISIALHRLKASARYALFDTDSWDARLYAYERDMWLSFSIPAMSGQGSRYFVLLEYDVFPWLTVWGRISATRYHDRDELGSGRNKIMGNVMRDVKFQARIKL